MRSVQSSPVFSARPATLLALWGALALVALLALPAPAQAHDTLLESDPVDGATLETSPEAITLTFSADVLEVSPLVRISDDSGEQSAEITPTVDGPVATAELPETLSAGTYTVQWRVVSSDGHPIEGAFEITVEQDPATSAAPDQGAGQDAPAASDAGGAEESSTSDSATPSSGDESAPTDSASAPTEDGTAAATEPAEDGGLSMPVLLGILAVVVLAVGGIAWAVLRRRD